jgi:hypothetical protein
MFPSLISDNRKPFDSTFESYNKKESNSIAVYIDYPDCNSINMIIKEYYNNKNVPAFIKTFYEECKKR